MCAGFGLHPISTRQKCSVGQNGSSWCPLVNFQWKRAAELRLHGYGVCLRDLLLRIRSDDAPALLQLGRNTYIYSVYIEKNRIEEETNTTPHQPRSSTRIALGGSGILDEDFDGAGDSRKRLSAQATRKLRTAPLSYRPVGGTCPILADEVVKWTRRARCVRVHDMGALVVRWPHGMSSRAGFNTMPPRAILLTRKLHILYRKIKC